MSFPSWLQAPYWLKNCSSLKAELYVHSHVSKSHWGLFLRDTFIWVQLTFSRQWLFILNQAVPFMQLMLKLHWTEPNGWISWHFLPIQKLCFWVYYPWVIELMYYYTVVFPVCACWIHWSPAALSLHLLTFCNFSFQNEAVIRACAQSESSSASNTASAAAKQQ